MKKQLKRISPLRAGIVLAVLYGLLGLIFVPFLLIAAALGAKAGPMAAFGGVFMAILFPIGYAIAGFIGGVISAAIYNLVAMWTGGLEFVTQDIAPAV